MENNTPKAITEQNIVVTVDDCHNVRNYSQYFGVSLTEGLDKALGEFIEEQTYKNQQAILRELCLWITTHPHESFKDPLWEKPKAKSLEFLPELMFDKEIDDMIQSGDSSESAE